VVTNDNKPEGKVIQFPKNKMSKIGIKVDNKAHEIRENIIFTENLCEALIVNMIHNMSENGMKVDAENFIRDTSFLIELVKSTIYRDLGMIHPLQDFVDYVTVVDKEGGDIAYGVDLEGVSKLVEDLDKED
jgi:hypothetical protein